MSKKLELKRPILRHPPSKTGVKLNTSKSYNIARSKKSLAWYVAYNATPQEKKPLVPKRKWKCPSKFTLATNWLVAAGEDSHEAKAQTHREARVLEAIYSHPSAIPPCPIVSPDVEGESHDNGEIPIIPTIPIEEREGEALPHIVNTDTNSSTSRNPPVNNEAILAMLRSLEGDMAVAAAAAATVAAVMESKGHIDTELLIKLISNPEMIRKLINQNGFQSELDSGTTSTLKQSSSCPVEPKPKLSFSLPSSNATPNTPLHPSSSKPVSVPEPNTQSHASRTLLNESSGNQVVSHARSGLHPPSSKPLSVPEPNTQSHASRTLLNESSGNQVVSHARSAFHPPSSKPVSVPEPNTQSHASRILLNESSGNQVVSHARSALHPPSSKPVSVPEPNTQSHASRTLLNESSGNQVVSHARSALHPPSSKPVSVPEPNTQSHASRILLNESSGNQVVSHARSALHPPSSKLVSVPEPNTQSHASRTLLNESSGNQVVSHARSVLHPPSSKPVSVPEPNTQSHASRTLLNESSGNQVVSHARSAPLLTPGPQLTKSISEIPLPRNLTNELGGPVHAHFRQVRQPTPSSPTLFGNNEDSKRMIEKYGAHLPLDITPLNHFNSQPKMEMRYPYEPHIGIRSSNVGEIERRYGGYDTYGIRPSTMEEMEKRYGGRSAPISSTMEEMVKKYGVGDPPMMNGYGPSLSSQQNFEPPGMFHSNPSRPLTLSAPPPLKDFTYYKSILGPHGDRHYEPGQGGLKHMTPTEHYYQRPFMHPDRHAGYPHHPHMPPHQWRGNGMIEGPDAKRMRFCEPTWNNSPRNWQ